MSLLSIANQRLPAPDDAALAMTVEDTETGRALQQAREDLALQSTSKLARGLGGLALDDLLAEPDEPIAWAVQGLLTKGAVGIIGAEAKGTKTWIACELMVALSSGTPVFGRFNVPERQWVLGCFLEDGKRNLKNRMRALIRGRNASHVDTSRIRVEVRPKINLQSADDQAWIVASARAMPEPPGIIFLDPLRNAHGAEENSSSEMQPIMDALARIRDATGACVMVSHHMGRPSKERQGQRLAHRLRGSTAIFGSVDAAILIETRKYQRTEQSATWKSLIDVELRELTPAPPFGLELDVQIEDGAAKVAGWAYHDDPSAMTESEDKKEGAEEKIVRLLEIELRSDRAMRRVPRHWSGPYLAEQLDMPLRTAQRHLRDLHRDGRVLQTGHGWRALDDLDEDQEA